MRRFDSGYSFRSSDFTGRSERPAPRPHRPARTPAAGTIQLPGQDSSQHPCAREEWCEARTVEILENGQRRITPMLTYQPFCPADRTLIGINLWRMPRLYLLLGAEIGNPARDGKIVRVPFGPSIPIRVDIDALQRRFVEVLVSWHERVAFVANHTDLDPDLTSKRLSAVAVVDASRVLRKNLDALLALGPETMTRTRFDELVNDDEMDGTKAGLEILTLEYLARAILGLTDAKPAEIPGVPCRMCDRLALRRIEAWEQDDNPDLGSVCMWCGDQLTAPEFRKWVREVTAAIRAQRERPTLANLPGMP